MSVFKFEVGQEFKDKMKLSDTEVVSIRPSSIDIAYKFFDGEEWYGQWIYASIDTTRSEEEVLSIIESLRKLTHDTKKYKLGASAITPPATSIEELHK